MPEKELEVLSCSEIEGLKAERKEIEADLRELEQAGKGTKAEGINRAHMTRRATFLDKVIHNNNNVPKGINKDQIAQEAKFLEGRITEGMPSYDEMNRPEKHPGAVMKHHLWEKRNASVIHRWKQLKRRLDPNDPTVSNIESLRRG